MEARKTVILLLALVLAFTAAASAQKVKDSTTTLKFKDLKDNHWAAPAVYDMVKLGVTKGYPDGTFRGNKQITRYETAVFLNKLAKSLNATDMKADLASLREEVKALKEAPAANPVAGSLKADWKFCNLLSESGSTRGAVANYRLKLSSTHDLGKGAKVKVNLDTMDYGYDDDGTTITGGVLATQLLDLEGDLTLDMGIFGLPDPVDLKVTFGPGPKQHLADPSGVIPSEIGTTYMRPNTGFSAKTKLFGADVAAGYKALSQATSGLVNTSDLNGQLGYTFQGVPLLSELSLLATGQYISTGIYSSTNRDLRAGVTFSAPLGNKIEASGTLDLGGREHRNWLAAGSLALNDVWDTGTVAVIRGAKVGSEFIDSRFSVGEFYFAGLDSFDRPFENGTVNVGGELVQKVSDDVRLVGKGDLRLQSDYKYESPKGRLTAQGGVSYTVAPNTILDAYYRVNHDKGLADTTDVAGLGLQYQF